MKNVKLMSLILATLMILAMFASCGEQPAETTAAEQETTAKVETTATPDTTKVETTTQEVTTAPETEHTAHFWSENVTFTAYDKRDEIGNAGYVAIRCTYCDAVKEDTIKPVILYCDFEGAPLDDAALDEVEKLAFNNTGIVRWAGNAEGKTRTTGSLIFDPINGNHYLDPANQAKLHFWDEVSDKQNPQGVNLYEKYALEGYAASYKYGKITVSLDFAFTKPSKGTAILGFIKQAGDETTGYAGGFGVDQDGVVGIFKQVNYVADSTEKILEAGKVYHADFVLYLNNSIENVDATGPAVELYIDGECVFAKADKAGSNSVFFVPNSSYEGNARYGFRLDNGATSYIDNFCITAEISDPMPLPPA